MILGIILYLIAAVPAFLAGYALCAHRHAKQRTDLSGPYPYEKPNSVQIEEALAIVQNTNPSYTLAEYASVKFDQMEAYQKELTRFHAALQSCSAVDLDRVRHHYQA